MAELAIARPLKICPRTGHRFRPFLFGFYFLQLLLIKNIWLEVYSFFYFSLASNLIHEKLDFTLAETKTYIFIKQTRLNHFQLSFKMDDWLNFVFLQMFQLHELYLFFFKEVYVILFHLQSSHSSRINFF